MSYSQGRAVSHDSPPSFQQAPAVQVSAPQVHSPRPSYEPANNLVKTLAEVITANRIPIPEPAVFFGDPLQYTDWKLSFLTLIDRKNLPVQEKLFFLRKYVGGSVKKAIEGYSLVGTESAYHAAWEVLEDRFGNAFIVGKAYCDKKQSWHKIATKDSKDLREFVDFLSSVETAMPYVQGLQAVNDCVENQRIVAKLPEWLSSRWNRAVTMFQDQHKAFPDFKYFVQFLSKEARIACNPIMSLQAIKPIETERSKQYDQDHKFLRNHRASAKTFTTSSSEGPIKFCVFCKRHGHTLNKCQKIMEKAVEEHVKFVQSEKLCFGCLKPGHYSRSCNSRAVCDRCGKRHPTCLHQDREKGNQEQRQSDNQAQSRVMQVNVESKLELPRAQQETPEVTPNRVVQEKRSTHTS